MVHEQLHRGELRRNLADISSSTPAQTEQTVRGEPDPHVLKAGFGSDLVLPCSTLQAKSFLDQPLDRSLLRQLREELPDFVPLHRPHPGRARESDHAIPPQQSRLEHYLLHRACPAQVTEEAPRQGVPGALSLRDGLATLRDQVRTKRFLQAIERAIQRLEQRFPSGDINVIDAGTGPIPILSIAAALQSPRVRCLGLELNPDSAVLARHTVAALGLSKQIVIVEGDATRYTPAQPFHLLLSETMDAALFSEPIVQIFTRLSPHLIKDGVRIPQTITIKALLAPESPRGLEGSRPTYCILRSNHEIHPYNWDNAGTTVTWHTDQGLPTISLPLDLSAVLARPESIDAEHFYFATSTAVQVFEDIALRSESLEEGRGPDSLISRSRRLQDFDPNELEYFSWSIRREEIESLQQLAIHRRCRPMVTATYRPGDEQRNTIIYVVPDTAESPRLS